MVFSNCENYLLVLRRCFQPASNSTANQNAAFFCAQATLTIISVYWKCLARFKHHIHLVPEANQDADKFCGFLSQILTAILAKGNIGYRIYQCITRTLILAWLWGGNGVPHVCTHGNSNSISKVTQDPLKCAPWKSTTVAWKSTTVAWKFTTVAWKSTTVTWNAKRLTKACEIWEIAPQNTIRHKHCMRCRNARSRNILYTQTTQDDR